MFRISNKRHIDDKKNRFPWWGNRYSPRVGGRRYDRQETLPAMQAPKYCGLLKLSGEIYPFSFNSSGHVNVIFLFANFSLWQWCPNLGKDYDIHKYNITLAHEDIYIVSWIDPLLLPYSFFIISYLLLFPIGHFYPAAEGYIFSVLCILITNGMHCMSRPFFI